MLKDTISTVSFTDAPCSINIQVLTPSGFSGQLTFRGVDWDAMLTEYLSVEMDLITKGFKPAPQRSFSSGFPKKEKEWIADKCPKDGGRLYHLVTKTGKDMCRCENSTFIGGVAGGCTFVAWGKNLADAKAKQNAWQQAQSQPANSDMDRFPDQE